MFAIHAPSPSRFIEPKKNDNLFQKKKKNYDGTLMEAYINEKRIVKRQTRVVVVVTHVFILFTSDIGASCWVKLRYKGTYFTLNLYKGLRMVRKTEHDTRIIKNVCVHSIYVHSQATTLKNEKVSWRCSFSRLNKQLLP